MGNVAWHDRSFPRGCISETEKVKLDPLVSKFWYCKGFQPLFRADDDNSITVNVHSYISYLFWATTDSEANKIPLLPTFYTSKISKFSILPKKNA